MRASSKRNFVHPSSNNYKMKTEKINRVTSKWEHDCGTVYMKIIAPEEINLRDLFSQWKYLVAALGFEMEGYELVNEEMEE